MRKVMVIMGISSLLAGSASAQGLDHLPELERNKILIERAEEAVLKYGPGYYRDDLPPILERGVVGTQNEFAGEEAAKYLNRVFYTVEYQYDKTEESFYWYYPAKTYIWADTGLVFRIIFGNGTGIIDLDKVETGSSGETPFVPFERQSPMVNPQLKQIEGEIFEERRD